MLYLFLAIFFNAYLIVALKAVERFRIPVLQAIVFNYITCVVTGTIVNGAFPITAAAPEYSWFWWAVLMGTLFISLFNLIGFTAQRISVSVASVANKLSLVIPFAFSIYLYGEAASALKIIGLIIALVAVVATCMPSAKEGDRATARLSPALRLLVPAVLFAGSGLLDTLIKYVEQNFLNSTNSDAYLITSFATAAAIGSLVLIGLVLSGKQKFVPSSVIAGVLIGIPNYFSIWGLVKVLQLYPGNSSAIIPINNMGIILVSTLAAFLLFRERLSTINRVGIALTVVSIALIAFG
ncbi:EamA/RhaT family transporter [Pseudocnuella soli]|uniref:EamA/RhaT family transporter n=1 Tax=Pseudocnuella soli TaxID=2502779 RepID=UPI001048F9DC|nr:EamA/RhaT family transporter [Pseudocnuella soli]